MPIGRRVTALTALVALVGTFACSSDSSLNSSGQTVADTEIDQTAASDVGESMAGQVTDLQSSEDFQTNFSSGSSTFASAIAGDNIGAQSRTVTCGGPDGDGWYSCTAYTDRGLTINRQVRFWSGGSLALGWNASTTDSVNHEWTRTGTVNSIAKPGKVFTFDDSDVWSLNVTHGSPVLHSWSGTGSRVDSSTYTVRSVERIFAYTAHDTASAVTFTLPRSANPYPTSGAISRAFELHVTAGGFSKTITREASVTFNGTETAQLTVGALTCDLDLLTRVVSGCH